AFLAAFLGLAAALGPDLRELDPRGVALALIAALSQAALLFLGRHLTRRHDPLTVLLNGNLVGLLFIGSLLIFLESPVLSSGVFGLGMLSVAAGLYVAGIGIAFLAVRAAGPIQTALFLNLEPVM